MELVDAPTMAPGSCCLTSMGAPLIDTGREVAQFGRGYLNPDVVREAAAVLGLVDGAEAQAQIDGARAEALELVEVLHVLDREYLSVVADYNALRASMCELLQHGATVDKRGTIRFREVQPGVRRLKD